jgi:hypothetical protein
MRVLHVHGQRAAAPQHFQLPAVGFHPRHVLLRLSQHAPAAAELLLQRMRLQDSREQHHKRQEEGGG